MHNIKEFRILAAIISLYIGGRIVIYIYLLAYYLIIGQLKTLDDITVVIARIIG